MKSFIIALTLLLASATLADEGTQLNHSIHVSNGVYSKTANGWSKSLRKVSDINSTTYIQKMVGGKDKLHRVGHRDVIVWIPATTDLSKDFIMVIWFHGHYGFVPQRTFEDRTLKQFVPLAKAKKNFVVVIPEMPWSIHTSTPTKRNSYVWMKKGSFTKFVDQTKGILLGHTSSELGRIDYKIVGHSAGGSTIKRTSLTGDLCKLNPSLVVWSDSSYGMWLDNSWDGCVKKSPNISVKVFVYQHGSPYRNATRFLGNFQDPPENLELHVMRKGWSHKLIGNNVVSLSKLLEEEGKSE